MLIAINSSLQKALQELRPIITQICAMLGVPGLAIGVIHEGKVMHEDYHSYRDVEARLVPDGNTVFYLASLTKAMSSPAVGILVDEGALSWDTPLREILPDLAEDPVAASENLSIVDVLSHRSGRARSDALFLGCDNNLLLAKEESLPTWNYLPMVT